MKKAVLAALLCAVSLSAHAHRVWVSTNHTHGGEILKAELGYGEFPEFEPIAKERLDIFKPLQLITPQGKQNLLQKGMHNYQFESAKPVPEGSFLVLAEYQPTFWSKNAAGWKRQNMKEMPDATYCEQTRMYGKNIVNVGHDSADTAVITRPVGQMLEIVPLDNPANATLTATFDGFDNSDRRKSHKVEAQAFSDTTGDDGTVAIIPLRQGFWKASVEHKADFADQKVCQKVANYTTLTFQIGHSHH